MTVITADHRQRLDAIRERTANARRRRQQARQQLDAARAAGDVEAQAVAQASIDDASTDLEIAERLESQMLSALAGIDGGNGHHGAGIFDDPATVETLQRLGNGSFPVGAIDLGPLQSREQLVAQIASGSWGLSKLAQ